MRELSKEYLELVEKVRGIHSGAADYMLLEAPKLEDFYSCDDLSDCFLWERTPQGIQFWSLMIEILGMIEKLHQL